MPTPKELEEKFWKALRSDMTMMLGLDGVEDGHARPRRRSGAMPRASWRASKMLIGIDPKKDYKEKVAKVPLSSEPPRPRA